MGHRHSADAPKIMQIIFLLIELFLPEIAQKLAGNELGVLRARLVRSGLGLLVLALLILSWLLFSHLLLQRLPLSQFNLFDLPIFTVWLLVVTGLVLLMLSRHEYPEKMSEEGKQPRTISNQTELQPCVVKKNIPSFHQGVIRNKTIRLQDCLSGVIPEEEWEFFVADKYCRLVNNMASGSRLYVNHALIAQSYTPMRFGIHKPPDLQAKITDASGKEYAVSIFFRAWLHIRVRVAINGEYLSPEFV